MGYRVTTGGVRVRRTDDGGLLVYDERTDVGHVLNPTEAVVYDLCDGSRSLQEMATSVAAQTGLPADDDIVLLALANLRDAGLLEESEPTTAALADVNRGLTRRSLLKRLAVGAGALALLPAIDSISGVSKLAAETGLSVFAAVSISITTTAGQAVTVQLSATGQPGPGTLSFVIVTPPQDGTATIVGSELTYVPNPGFEGTDSLTYQAILNPTTTTTAGTTTAGTSTAGTSPATTPTPPTTPPLSTPFTTRMFSTTIRPPTTPGVASLFAGRGDDRHEAVGQQTVSAAAITSTVGTVTVTVNPAGVTASPSFTG